MNSSGLANPTSEITLRSNILIANQTTNQISPRNNILFNERKWNNQSTNMETIQNKWKGEYPQTPVRRDNKDKINWILHQEKSQHPKGNHINDNNNKNTPSGRLQQTKFEPSNNTQDEFLRSTLRPDLYNQILSETFKHAINHECNTQNTNQCGNEETIFFYEKWFLLKLNNDMESTIVMNKVTIVEKIIDDLPKIDTTQQVEKMLLEISKYGTK